MGGKTQPPGPACSPWYFDPAGGLAFYPEAVYSGNILMLVKSRFNTYYVYPLITLSYKNVVKLQKIIFPCSATVVWVSHTGKSINNRSIKDLHRKKTYQYKCLGIRELVLDDLDNSHDAATDLLSSVSMIVCTHPQHYNLKKTKRFRVNVLYMEIERYHKVKLKHPSVRMNKHAGVFYF